MEKQLTLLFYSGLQVGLVTGNLRRFRFLVLVGTGRTRQRLTIGVEHLRATARPSEAFVAEYNPDRHDEQRKTDDGNGSDE